MCSVVIRPTSSTTTFLNLGELELYNAAGARIPAASIVMSLSSTYSSATDASMCNDGNLASHCDTNNMALGDPSPTLRAFYLCGGGGTALSRVVVHNRPDCCQDRLTQFTMDFLNAARAADRPSFAFTTTQASYTVRNLAGGPAGQWGCGRVYGLACRAFNASCLLLPLLLLLLLLLRCWGRCWGGTVCRCV